MILLNDYFWQHAASCSDEINASKFMKEVYLFIFLFAKKKKKKSRDDSPTGEKCF